MQTQFLSGGEAERGREGEEEDGDDVVVALCSHTRSVFRYVHETQGGPRRSNGRRNMKERGERKTREEEGRR